jgi:hypothetical protein
MLLLKKAELVLFVVQSMHLEQMYAQPVHLILNDFNQFKGPDHGSL